MADTRRRNVNWNVGDKIVEWDQCTLAVLMDIRDELRVINRVLNCHRIPRALDAMYELGVEARRRKREAAEKKRKAKSNARND